MKVFISWSGQGSEELAAALREWLPNVIQSLEPFLSREDITPGDRGLEVLAQILGDCSFGIVCLTQDNKDRPWINFEAGALSKAVGVGKVVPFLLDTTMTEVTGPLKQFQGIVADDRDRVWQLMKVLAAASDPRLSESTLQRTFEKFWPELEERVSELRRLVQADSSPTQERRSDRDILEEILTLARNFQVEQRVTIRSDLHSPQEGRDALDIILRELGRRVDIEYTVTRLPSSRSILVQFETRPSNAVHLRQLLRTMAEYYGVSIYVRGMSKSDESTQEIEIYGRFNPEDSALL